MTTGGTLENWSRKHFDVQENLEQFKIVNNKRVYSHHNKSITMEFMDHRVNLAGFSWRKS